MQAIRLAISIAVAVGAFWLIDHDAISLYRANLDKRTIADRTNDAYRLQTAQREYAGELARRNADDLRPVVLRFPNDADAHVIRAANLRLVGRDFEASSEYATAVRYEPTPELYFNLGQTQLALGRRDDAGESFRRAIAFNPAFSERVEQLYGAESH